MSTPTTICARCNGEILNGQCPTCGDGGFEPDLGDAATTDATAAAMEKLIIGYKRTRPDA